jgi:hypothetical protein
MRWQKANEVGKKKTKKTTTAAAIPADAENAQDIKFLERIKTKGYVCMYVCM